MPITSWNAAEIAARIRKGALRGVMVGASLVHDRATELIISPPKSGRVYRRRGVSHQASAPGEAPANDTGRLVASGRIILDAANLSATVNWSTTYARPLELGSEKMAPRPYARRALSEKVGEIEEAVRSEIAKELSRE